MRSYYYKVLEIIKLCLKILYYYKVFGIQLLY